MVISHCQAFSARPSSGARAAAAAASQAGFHWVNGIHAERPGPGQAESATSLFSTFEADPKAGTCRTCRRPQCSCCGTLIFISIPPVYSFRSCAKNARSGGPLCTLWQILRLWTLDVMKDTVRQPKSSSTLFHFTSPHYTLHHIAKCNRRSLQIRCTLFRLHSFEAPHKFMHCRCSAYDWLYRFPAVSRRRMQASQKKCTYEVSHSSAPFKRA